MIGIKNRLAFVGKGAVGGLIGTICCLLPAVAIAIGLTGGLVTTLVGLGKFRFMVSSSAWSLWLLLPGVSSGGGAPAAMTNNIND